MYNIHFKQLSFGCLWFYQDHFDDAYQGEDDFDGQDDDASKDDLLASIKRLLTVEISLISI